MNNFRILMIFIMGGGSTYSSTYVEKSKEEMFPKANLKVGAKIPINGKKSMTNLSPNQREEQNFVSKQGIEIPELKSFSEEFIEKMKEEYLKVEKELKEKQEKSRNGCYQGYRGELEYSTMIDYLLPVFAQTQQAFLKVDAAEEKKEIDSDDARGIIQFIPDKEKAEKLAHKICNLHAACGDVLGIDKWNMIAEELENEINRELKNVVYDEIIKE